MIEHMKFSSDHTWARVDADGLVSVGITAFAAHALGDVVYVQLPRTGRVVRAREAAAVVESVKSASDVLMPLAGKVVAVNELLLATPELVNQAPEAEGWFMRIEPGDAGELDRLLDAAAYAASLPAA